MDTENTPTRFSYSSEETTEKWTDDYQKSTCAKLLPLVFNLHNLSSTCEY